MAWRVLLAAAAAAASTAAALLRMRLLLLLLCLAASGCVWLRLGSGDRLGGLATSHDVRQYRALAAIGAVAALVVQQRRRRVRVRLRRRRRRSVDVQCASCLLI